MKNLFETFGNALNPNPKTEIKCTQCGDAKETLSEIVYSQGNKVCLKCKDENKESDKIAFDRDEIYKINNKINNKMHKHIELAKKLKALADKGIEGEQINAVKMLNDLLKKYNITIEDIDGEKQEDYFFKLNKDEVDLWSQIVKNVNYKINIYGEIPKSKIKELSLKGNYIATCTASEYIEIEAKYKFYLRAYKQELEVFYNGFIHANQLYSSEPPTKSFSELSPKEKEEYERALLISSNIKKQSFRKQLN